MFEENLWSVETNVFGPKSFIKKTIFTSCYIKPNSQRSDEFNKIKYNCVLILTGRAALRPVAVGQTHTVTKSLLSADTVGQRASIPGSAAMVTWVTSLCTGS